MNKQNKHRPISTHIQKLFQDYLTSQNLPWELTAFDGRSDYGKK